ncbi:MAG: hypothetical protein AB7O62_13770 [Pirellulales bacterium]
MTKQKARSQMNSPRHQSASERLTDKLLKEAEPTFVTWHAAEPKLLFANRMRCEDPKTGLSEFGPAALDSTPRTSIRVAAIGTGETIQLLKNWAETARSCVYAGLNSKGQPFDPLVAPRFPGFDFESPFRCNLEFDDRLTVTLTDRDVLEITRCSEFSQRVKAAIDLITAKLRVLADREPVPDVAVIAMPKELEDSIGPSARADQPRPRMRSKTEKKAEKRLAADRKSGQLHFDFGDKHSEVESELSLLFRDFHNSLKAHAMKAKLPTQLVWNSTLLGGRTKENPATTAWNFFTALYYKAGNMPWELEFGTNRTCFVGITFYRESADPNSPTRTCLAQAFSETGEGLVLRGERVEWDKERDRKPHLTQGVAESLLRQVLELYKEHFNGPPNRVVIHKTSRYWPEELTGLRAALGDVHSYDFLAIERRGIRFLRMGKEPPVRGSVIQLAKRNYLIYTQGYVPFLRQYPGPGIPNPLEIVEHHGDSSAERVCSEILALTKLNWNTCKFASAEPITIAFSRQVATIIKEMPADVEPSTKYRFYM